MKAQTVAALKADYPLSLLLDIAQLPAQHISITTARVNALIATKTSEPSCESGFILRKVAMVIAGCMP